MAKPILGFGSDKSRKAKDSGQWREPRSGPYGLWCLVSEPGKDEGSTTNNELGQVWVLGNMRPRGYSEPLRKFEILVEASVESTSAAQLDEWCRKRESVNLGLSQRGTSYSLDQVQVRKVLEDDIPVRNSPMRWFKLQVDAGYELAYDGAEQWPRAKKRAEEYAEWLANQQLYAYGAYPEKP